MSGCSFTGPGWYRLLWRGARDAPGTSRVVWIQELNDPEHPDFLGVWPDQSAVNTPRRLMARIKREVCERSLVARVEIAML